MISFVTDRAGLVEKMADSKWSQQVGTNSFQTLACERAGLSRSAKASVVSLSRTAHDRSLRVEDDPATIRATHSLESPSLIVLSQAAA